MLRRPTASRRSTKPPPSDAPPGEAGAADRGLELLGKRAVVTGASSGIGRAIALELARAGADVLVAARASHAGAVETARFIRASGRRAPVALADLATPRGCRALLAAAWRELGGVDIWVNNAGADILTAGRWRLSFEAKLDLLLRVDLGATVRLARAAGERMRVEGGGAIINMGWDGGRSGMEGDSGQLFAAAKAAVMGFTASLALSLAPEVRVNCLAPGWIRTGWGERAPRRWQERVRRETPLRRWGTPADVAGLCRFLASPAAGFITGQTIAVNGGAVRF